MDEAEIYTKLTNVFRDVFDDDDLTPHADMVAEDVEDWDSLSHIRLILTIEKTFNMRFSTVEVGSLEKVGDVVLLLKKKLR